MQVDLFSPQDAAALFAIRAANAQRTLSRAELQALFEAQGLLPDTGAPEARSPARQGA